MDYFQMAFLAHEIRRSCCARRTRGASRMPSDRPIGMMACFTTSCANSLAFFAQAKVRR